MQQLTHHVRAAVSTAALATTGAHTPNTIEGIDAWSHQVANNFAVVSIDDADSDFRGLMRTTELDGVKVSRVQVPAHVVHRTARHITPDERSHFVLCVQLDGGRSMVVQDGREAMLNAGDMTLYDTAKPYTLVHEDGVNCIGVVIPESLIRLPRPALSALAATVMPATDRVTAAAANSIESFQETLDAVPELTRLRMGHTFVSIFETLCTNWMLQGETRELAPKLAQREAVLRYIGEHIADPDLNPQGIANAHYISLRSLHALAQGTGATVSGWIRSQRLERCRAELADVSLSHITVAEIGARWGFTHPPHFTTVFRSAFGETPSVFRRRMMR